MRFSIHVPVSTREIGILRDRDLKTQGWALNFYALPVHGITQRWNSETETESHDNCNSLVTTLSQSASCLWHPVFLLTLKISIFLRVGGYVYRRKSAVDGIFPFYASSTVG